MFFVIIYSAIDQGYIGLSLASCHKDEIWDLGAELGPFQGFGPNWDQVPNLGHHSKHCSCYLDILFSETKFSETETFFRDQIYRNRNRDFFSETKFSETTVATGSRVKFLPAV